MKECRKCGTKIADEADECPECGARLDSEAETEDRAEENTEVTTEETADDKVNVKTDNSPADDDDEDIRIYSLRKPKVTPVKAQNDEDSDIKIAGPGGSSSTRKFSAEEIESIRKKSPLQRGVTSVDSPVTTIRAKRRLPPMNPTSALLAALTTIIIVTAVILLALAPSHSRYISRSQLLTIIHNSSGELCLYKNGKLINSSGIKSGSISFSTTNTSGSSIAVLTTEGSTHSLYYSSGKNIVLVDSDVYEVQMSAGADSLIYLSSLNGNCGKLYYFNGRESTQIAAEVFPGACISPDGKTLAYSRLSGYDSSTSVGYIWQNDKIQELGTGFEPFAISDKAEYLYYFRKQDNDNALYAMSTKRGKSIKLSDSPGNIYFSSDLTQILFHDFGDIFLVNSGSDRVLIAKGDDCAVLLPYGCPVMSFGTNATGYILGVSSFKGTYIRCGSTLYYYSEKGSAGKVTSNYSQAYLSSDMKTVFYLKNSKIRSVNGTKSRLTPETLATDALSFAISANGRHVYYISTDKELIYKTGNNNPVLLEEEPGIESADSRLIFAGSSFLYVKDNTLMLVKGSSLRTQELEVERIDSISGNMYCIYVTGSNGSENIYLISGDGKKFERY